MLNRRVQVGGLQQKSTPASVLGLSGPLSFCDVQKSTRPRPNSSTTLLTASPNVDHHHVDSDTCGTKYSKISVRTGASSRDGQNNGSGNNRLAYVLVHSIAEEGQDARNGITTAVREAKSINCLTGW